jgi:peptidoglycan/xylan/chitin deacetylase (PgdA/CDA1 family)
MNEVDPNSLPSRILAINYHYCRLPINGKWPGLKGVTPSALEYQLTQAAMICTPFHLNAIESPARKVEPGKLGFLITFDDGMSEIVNYALPIVNKYSFPSIIFCCAMPYVEGKVLNVQKSHLLQGRWGWDGFRRKFMSALEDDAEGRCRDESPQGLDKMYRYDDEATGAFKRLLNVELPYRVVDRILDRMFDQEFGSQSDAVKALYLSLDDIQRCGDKGVSIGLHTYAHRMMSRLSPQDLTEDLDKSLALFRDSLGLDIRSISYPYGIKGSWNDETKRHARERNLHLGFTLGREVYRPMRLDDAMEIPRYDVNDVFNSDGNFKNEFSK